MTKAIWKLVDKRLFSLEVFLVGGPVPKKFTNKVICREIDILGEQTLEDLHYAVFDAFDREEQHLYEFQVGGKGPMDPNAKRYVLPDDMEDDGAFGHNPPPAGDLTKTSIGSLGLKEGDSFGYWFDFGDDWWHQIRVTGIQNKGPKGKYPKLVKKTGKSPPQYPAE